MGSPKFNLRVAGAWLLSAGGALPRLTSYGDKRGSRQLSLGLSIYVHAWKYICLDDGVSFYHSHKSSVWSGTGPTQYHTIGLPSMCSLCLGNPESLSQMFSLCPSEHWTSSVCKDHVEKLLVLNSRLRQLSALFNREEK